MWAGSAEGAGIYASASPFWLGSAGHLATCHLWHPMGSVRHARQRWTAWRLLAAGCRRHEGSSLWTQHCRAAAAVAASSDAGGSAVPAPCNLCHGLCCCLSRGYRPKPALRGNGAASPQLGAIIRGSDPIWMAQRQESCSPVWTPQY